MGRSCSNRYGIRRSLTSRMDYQKRSIIPPTNHYMGSYGRFDPHCCSTPIWRQSRNLVLSWNGCFDGSIYPLQHPENNAVIPSTRLRRSISYTFCLAHDHVLVHTSNIHRPVENLQLRVISPANNDVIKPPLRCLIKQIAKMRIIMPTRNQPISNLHN